MRGFQALKSLDIDMAASENNRIRIETMFSLFSRLDCLCLSGWWYHNESDKITRLPPKRQWRIKNLKIDPIDTSLIRHCPVLHELKTVEPNFDMFGRMDLIRNTLAQKLQQPSSLETLEFFCDPRRAFFKFKINHPDRVDPSKPHGLEGSSAPYYGTNRPSFPLWWSTTEVVHILQ
ncbi:hypothetical protein BGX23_008590 [Mortierella sp. AD031]|nr:hypothetical protein BGX23_008590 [Mortierella sp. AD031]KAG0217420.1 hypothetical protein BGX33_010605 [Mortierella sp. NVP41]